MVTSVARAGRRNAGPSFTLGMQFEAYCTAIGKVLLASLPEHELDDFMDDGELIALTASAIINRDALRQQLARITLAAILGVSPAAAQAIATGRGARKFATLADLSKVAGLSPRQLEARRQRIGF